MNEKERERQRDKRETIDNTLLSIQRLTHFIFQHAAGQKKSALSICLQRCHVNCDIYGISTSGPFSINSDHQRNIWDAQIVSFVKSVDSTLENCFAYEQLYSIKWVLLAAIVVWWTNRQHENIGYGTLFIWLFWPFIFKRSSYFWILYYWEKNLRKNLPKFWLILIMK